MGTLLLASEMPVPRSRTVESSDDVCYYICWRLKLEGETENMGVCTKERKGVAAEVLMATPCTTSERTRRCTTSEMMMLMMMFITIFDVYARERERFFLILCEGFNCGKRSEEDGALSGRLCRR